MPGQMRGGDLGHLDKLSQDFKANGTASADIKKAIDSQLANTTWIGPAADKFRSEWNQFSPTLIKIQNSLDEASTAIGKHRANIDASTS